MSWFAEHWILTALLAAAYTLVGVLAAGAVWILETSWTRYQSGSVKQLATAIAVGVFWLPLATLFYAFCGCMTVRTRFRHLFSTRGEHPDDWD